MQDIESAGWRADASGDSSRSRIRSPEHKPTRCLVQVLPPHDPLSDLRFQRAVIQLHALGPRAVGEFLAETGERHRCRAWIDQRLDAYRRLDPELLQALGGEHFPPPPIHVVAGRP